MRASLFAALLFAASVFAPALSSPIGSDVVQRRASLAARDPNTQPHDAKDGVSRSNEVRRSTLVKDPESKGKLVAIANNSTTALP